MKKFKGESNNKKKMLNFNKKKICYDKCSFKSSLKSDK